MKKIQTSSGLARGLFSILLPGAGHMIVGEIGTGIILFVCALIFGAMTFGLGWFIVGLVSLACTNPIHSCPRCLSKVHHKATMCKDCNLEFED